MQQLRKIDRFNLRESIPVCTRVEYNLFIFLISKVIITSCCTRRKRRGKKRLQRKTKTKFGSSTQISHDAI